MIKILAFSGSSRLHSFNQNMVKIASQGASESGVEVNVISLGDFPLPIYNEDLESKEGLPENAQKLKQLFLEHDGFLIASPEYNSAFSPLLKNAIDWVSRSGGKKEPSLVAFKGKTAGIISASPGPLGGIRGLVFLRMLLENIQVMVIPEQKCIPNAYDIFDENGMIKDQAIINDVKKVGKRLAEILIALNPQ